MVELVPRIAEHLAALPKRLDSFRELEYQSEGWLKTELLLALLGMKAGGLIEEFDREVSLATRQQVDVLIVAGGCRHWVELKHWLIGMQRGSHYATRFYFTDKRGCSLMNDVRKLVRIDDDSRRWVLALLTTNPGEQDWRDGLAAYEARPDAIPLASRTDPSDFPNGFFLGLLEVTRP